MNSGCSRSSEGKIKRIMSLSSCLKSKTHNTDGREMYLQTEFVDRLKKLVSKRTKVQQMSFDKVDFSSYIKMDDLLNYPSKENKNHVHSAAFLVARKVSR